MIRWFSIAKTKYCVQFKDWHLYIVVKAKVQFEKDIAGIIEDCDAYEIRVIADIAKSVKDTLRRDAYLRKNDT